MSTRIASLVVRAAWVLGVVATPGAQAQQTDTVSFEPYIDVTLWPPADLQVLAGQMGHDRFTLAFIQSDSTCNPKWAGVIGFDDPTYDFEGKIERLKAAGGDVVISFGGAAGITLADACGSVAQTKDAYRAVVDQYQVYRLDFDIEGAAVASPESVQRRSSAIALLQQELEAEGRTLEVSLTLPTLPTGLTGDDSAPVDAFGGYDVVRSARDAGVDVAVVNVMAMDYYQPVCASAHLDEYSPIVSPMGQCAIDAANSLRAQLGSIYPSRTDSELWAMVGVTPMIGQNDALAEVFTLSDANHLKSFAEDKGFGRLSMWSVSRDNPCPGGGATYSCNGISAPLWAYTEVFRGDFTPPTPQCEDGRDNDDDGLIDGADPGCDDAIGDGLYEDSDDVPPPSSGSVRVSHTITSDWGSGYNADIAITNQGSDTISGWTLEFDSVNPIGSLWNGVKTGNGSHYTVTNAAWNGNLAPGASVTIGFGATGSSANGPTGCVFNGNGCSFDSPAPPPPPPPPPPPGECEDGVDNDADGVIDGDDPGCISGVGDGSTESSADPSPPPTNGDVFVDEPTITSDWGSGYCASARVINDTDSAVSGWAATFMASGTISSLWNVQWSQTGSTIQLTPSGWNNQLTAGASIGFGFCASR